MPRARRSPIPPCRCAEPTSEENIVDEPPANLFRVRGPNYLEVRRYDGRLPLPPSCHVP